MHPYKFSIRTKAAKILSVPIDPTSKTRVNRRLDIDPFGASQKLLNPCGFPMNDIMAFETAQSDSVARTILQRINVIPETGMTQDGRSVDEHFADLCPSDWSSPAEYVRYQRKVAENYYNRIKLKADQAKLEKDKENVIKFDDDKSE